VRRETDIAKPALELLREMNFDLYQEVPYGGRADIVGVLAGRTVCVCEVKAALTFDVIAQAKDWRGDAQWVFVAVPGLMNRGPSDGRRLAYDLCESLGIGIIEIEVESNFARAQIRLFPRLNRFAKPEKLLAELRPEHKTFAAAGSCNGRFWSRWRDSVRRLAEHVKDHPGITLKELIEIVPHHWSTNASAKGCVARQIHAGLIKGIRLETVAKKMRVYPVEPVNAS